MVGVGGWRGGGGGGGEGAVFHSSTHTTISFINVDLTTSFDLFVPFDALHPSQQLWSCWDVASIL